MDWQSTQSVVKSLGDIDLLVNNAGVTELTPFIDVTSDVFDRQALLHSEWINTHSCSDAHCMSDISVEVQKCCAWGQIFTYWKDNTLP